jgi:glycosyltransferase involved in cell wall biosynthesis
MRSVFFDADVLGRRRTGDETYAENLLRELACIAPDAGIRLAAATRHPDLVPDGVEPVHLRAGSQELRMAWRLPRLLRRLRPGLGHFQHAQPLRCPCPAVVTIHDVSFARDPALMPLADRWTFSLAVPRAVRRAARVLTVSERTKRDLIELYNVPPGRIVVTPNAVDPAFSPGGTPDSYALFVGAIQRRKDPLAAASAAREAGLELVAAGPRKDERLARELEAAGVDVRGYVPKAELARLYRRAACLVLPTRYEGFGLPVLEAMASGTPVVTAPDAAVREVAGDAALYAEGPELGGAIRRALAERDRLVQAGLERARAFSWAETARRTLAVYLEVLSR